MKKYFNSLFFKDVLTLLSGTVIAQALGMALVLITTRIFQPQHFATLEQFAMILAILSVIATGKYEFAVVLPKKDGHAKQLVQLAIRIAGVFSLFCFVLVFFFKDTLADYYENESLKTALWLIPIALFGISVANTTNYWFTRKKKFTIPSSNKVLNAAVNEPSKIALGLSGFLNYGLVLGVTISNAVSAIFMYKKFQTNSANVEMDESTLRDRAKEYSRYPKLTVWGSILNRFAQWAHIALFSLYFGPVVVGVLAISRRVVMNPLNIISQSFSQVYYQKLAEVTNPTEIKKLYLKTLWPLLGLGFLMIAVIWLLPEGTLAFILGDEWFDVQNYLRILVFWFAFNFAVSALSFVNHRIQRQDLMLLLDFIHFVFVAVGIFLALKLEQDILGALIFLCISKVLYYVINILVTIFALNEHIKKAQ